MAPPEAVAASPSSDTHSMASGDISDFRRLSRTITEAELDKQAEQFRALSRGTDLDPRHDLNLPDDQPDTPTKPPRSSWIRKAAYALRLPGVAPPYNATLEQETRHVFFNCDLPQQMINNRGEPILQYPRNKIRTTKYTPLSFIPKNLFFQFHNVANVYFLFLVILGAFPIFGVDNAGLAAVPLIVIVCITAIKDLIEDFGRSNSDTELNNSWVHILKGVPNPNATEDQVGPWRLMKKACSRGMRRFGRWMWRSVSKKRRAEYREAQEAEKAAAAARESRAARRSGDSDTFSLARARTSGSIAGFGVNPALAALQTAPPPQIAASGGAAAHFTRDAWKNIYVGDVLKIRDGEEVPADVLILSTSDPEGGCYIETKNLDGETNLKSRQALDATRAIRHASELQRCQFSVQCGGPHPNLYSFTGVLRSIPSEPNRSGLAEAIAIDNMLLRGSTLRNTRWVIGIVLFTGPETKIMLNAGQTPTKKSRISRELNFNVLVNFVLLFILCFVSGLINGLFYNKQDTSATYFGYGSFGGTAAKNGVIAFFVGIILYQSLVPISLYVSIEIIKTLQAFFIYSDIGMYYAPLDYPCYPKSWGISDDLGQIEYVFSDKTGTLTQNVMEFKKCTVAGRAFGLAYTEAQAGQQRRAGLDVTAEAAKAQAEIREDREKMSEELRQYIPGSSAYDSPFTSSAFVAELRGANGTERQQASEMFLLALALCNTVVTETDRSSGKSVFRAESPDEAALVDTARGLGYEFVNRDRAGCYVSIRGSEPQHFPIREFLAFTSARRRMSVVAEVALPGRKEAVPVLFTKGADSALFPRLAANTPSELITNTALHLESFAREGLRTLVVAYRELSRDEFARWSEKYAEAKTALENREEALAAACDELETDLQLLGGTAIEDRLQEGVPSTIALLAEAGIKIWVLTGDKVETAINIGFSCNLLDVGMELLVVTQGEEEGGSNGGSNDEKAEKEKRETQPDNVSTPPLPSSAQNTLPTPPSTPPSSSSDPSSSPSPASSSIEAQLDAHLARFGLKGTPEELEDARGDHSTPEATHAVIIDGPALATVLESELHGKFVLLCKQCRAVLCCRVSPAQKAAVVKTVRQQLGVMTLAVGDGANDVAMIQAADVGVGIAGEEGRQAAMAADFAVARFRFLARLLLVHGRWSYKRLAEMIPCFFYKNVVFTLALFWYGIYNNFDGSYLFEYTYLMFYNLAFTSLPVIFLGVLDQDVSDSVALAVPQLYRSGILGIEWSQLRFWLYMIDGLYQSVICFYFAYLLYLYPPIVSSSGLPLDQRYWVGIYVASSAVVACNLYVLRRQFRWDWLTLLINALSNLVVFFWTGVWTVSATSATEFYDAARQVFGAAAFWAYLFATIVACLVPREIVSCIRRIYFPRDVDVVREEVSLGKYDAYGVGYDPTLPEGEKQGSEGLEKAEAGAGADAEADGFIDAEAQSRSSSVYEAPARKGKLARVSRFLRHPRHPRSGKGGAGGAGGSLHDVRLSMVRSGEYSSSVALDRVRTSASIPGLSEASELISMHSRATGGR